METDTIAGSLLVARTGQSQQAMSTSMMRQAADRQNEIANLLAQNAQQAPQPASSSNSGFSFSIFV